MFLGKCSVIYQFDDHLQALNTASSQQWHDSSDAASITSENIKLFILNNYDLIVSHQGELQNSLLTLANRVEKEYSDDPDALKIAKEIKHLTNIIPNEILAEILGKVEEVEDDSKNVVKLLSRTSQSSKSLRDESTKKMGDFINMNSIPISSDLGITNPVAAISLVKRLGPNLEYLKLDGKDVSVQSLTLLEFRKILEACPNLKELHLMNLDSINDEIWEAINSLSQLRSISIITCKAIQNIPILQPQNLNSIIFYGNVKTIASPLPPKTEYFFLSIFREEGEGVDPIELQLPAMPNQLKRLYLYNVPNNTFPNLPDSLEELSLENIVGLAPPNHWPPNLTTLELITTSFVTPIQNLPNLKTLTIDRCIGLNNQLMVPNSVESLRLEIIDQTVLNNLPPNLKKFSFISEQAQLTIPDTLPQSLELLHISKTQHTWPHFISLIPSTLTTMLIFDPTLTDLDVALPPHLTFLELELPACRRFQITGSIKSLVLTNCDLSELPPLPHSLESLSLSRSECPNITLANMPELTYLDANPVYLCIDNCPQLIKTMALEKTNSAPTYLTIKNDLTLTKIVNLFNNSTPIISLEIVNCQHVHSLNNLRKEYPNLLFLNIDTSFSMKTIENLPLNLTKLGIHRCPALETLNCSLLKQLISIEGEFSNYLTYLSLSSCTSLFLAPRVLPESLNMLVLTDVPNFESIWTPEYLSHFIRKSNFNYFQSIDHNNTAPPRLEIVITKREDLNQHATNLSKATHVYLKDNLEIESFDLDIGNAHELIISNCPQLNKVVVHSKNLSNIEIKGCENLKTIDLSECSKLTCFGGKFPINLEHLNLSKCALRVAPFELPRSLRTFNVTEVDFAFILWSNSLMLNYQKINPQLNVVGYQFDSVA